MKYSFSTFNNIQTVRTGRVTKAWHHVASLLSCWLISLLNAHAPSAVSAFLNRFSLFVWTVVKRSKNSTCGREFFWKGRRKLRFQTKTDTCKRGLACEQAPLLGKTKRNCSRRDQLLFVYSREASSQAKRGLTSRAIDKCTQKSTILCNALHL